ncbi:hsp70-like protein [Lepidopterella palustris CBS 459.81]|uniref:Hsp70-like protein n=1 Tax=Lepidopterella palustris CBS 459.81 TaxID=1314670 RepID=A0A8E2EK38_9PEZI|nr:hsp70-like protein [Lepidopterella palustris CBS 459.81]
MGEPSLSELLKWSIENSEASLHDPSSQVNTGRPLQTAALAALFGGPSDADLMRQRMEIIENKTSEHTLQQRITCFDDFEQLIESLDNANNLEILKLWTPLVGQLENQEAELRFYAAWCCGTAVQNNEKSQERLLIVGAIPKLIKLATEDPVEKVRKKAIYALSSAVRNYQPALDAVVESVPEDYKPETKLDATDMDSVDSLIQKLRDNSARLG